MDIHKTLSERGEKYGSFEDISSTSQSIKSQLKSGRSWDLCNPQQKEALEMIAHKLARIVNGDPNYDDSWRDIIGYSTLVIDKLTERN